MRRTILGMLAAGLAMALGVMPARAQPVLHAVGLERQYADVMRQIGGPYVRVIAIETNPDTDPHEFELSPAIAQAFSGADVIVANGLGYDAWADRFLAGSHATVISAQAVLKLPDSTKNPHLWYDPATMPAVARAVAAAFAARDPAHAAVYHANERAFEASLVPWAQALAAVKTRYAGTKVAVTEPVANGLLRAAGLSIVTPFSLQAAIMNGTDPAPQDVTAQQALLAPGEARILVYNEQVTDALTQSFLALARTDGVPVLGVYELMPATATSYQGWMQSETAALARALAAGGH
ncbi:metal ABC transporter solute-binding protein, Zn/Mn family [Acidocella sp.]|uniref:metal ABC transporter solute-binding protein, Zn/Mn family n=1 Tax=Acidocella sp. TaxID=50710 RepID=UPI00262DB7C2|nr:zinc ABC transporter substrate-binding protein [Acidocella sp.]